MVRREGLSPIMSLGYSNKLKSNLLNKEKKFKIVYRDHGKASCRGIHS